MKCINFGYITKKGQLKCISTSMWCNLISTSYLISVNCTGFPLIITQMKKKALLSVCPSIFLSFIPFNTSLSFPAPLSNLSSTPTLFPMSLCWWAACGGDLSVALTEVPVQWHSHAHTHTQTCAQTYETHTGNAAAVIYFNYSFSQK